MATRRARNLTDADIQQIVEILDGWTGKLTWNLLIAATHDRLCTSMSGYVMPSSWSRTRQPLRARLRNAPRRRKCRWLLSASPGWAENERLLEQFVIWAYNAYTKGIDEKTLNRPLPPVNRGRTPSRVGTE